MALTFRDNNLAPLSYDEMDSNWRFFTGSFTNTGTITAEGFTSNGNISASGVINGQNFYGGVFGRIYPDSSQTSNNQFFTANANGLNSNASFNVTGNITASGDISSSAASTASFGTYLGDGSQLTGVTSEWDGSHLGDASITGSLTIEDSTSFFTPLLKITNTAGGRLSQFGTTADPDKIVFTNGGNITTVGNIEADGNISASADVYGVTGSFSHLLGASPLTVESDNFNIDSSGNITSSANISASGDLYCDYLTTTRDITVGRDATFSRNITKKSGNGQTTYFPEIDSASTVGAQTSTCGIFGVDTDKITTCIIRVGCKIVQASANKGGYFEFCYTYSNDGGGNILQIGLKTDIIDQATTGLSAGVQNNAGSISIQVTSTNVGENYSWSSSVEKIVLV